jgi:hypothetical protein
MNRTSIFHGCLVLSVLFGVFAGWQFKSAKAQTGCTTTTPTCTKNCKEWEYWCHGAGYGELYDKKIARAGLHCVDAWVAGSPTSLIPVHCTTKTTCQKDCPDDTYPRVCPAGRS